MLRYGHTLICFMKAQSGKLGLALRGGKIGSALGGRVASASSAGRLCIKINDLLIIRLIIERHRPVAGGNVVLGGCPRRIRLRRRGSEHTLGYVGKGKIKIKTTSNNRILLRW